MKKLLKLGNLTNFEREFMEEHKVEFSKKLSEFKRESRKKSKPTKCLACKKETTQFCNSHSVPASFLRNIAVAGKVFTNNKILDIPALDVEEGVNKTGTFRVVCRDCDSKIFQEYESSANYEHTPTNKMIAQIAMKNHLRNIGKRRNELALYQNLKELDKFDSESLAGMLEVSNLDLNEYLNGFKRAKKVIDKNWENEYYLFFYEKLDYVIPLAFQGEVSLHFDLDGNIINDVYNNSKRYKIQTLHISVFPLENSSVLMLFIDKRSTRYRGFYQQFKTLNSGDKLSLINFIIFSYAEDVFMSKKVRDIFLKNKNLQAVSGLTSIQVPSVFNNENQSLKDAFDFSKMNTIPNFLLLNIKDL